MNYSFTDKSYQEKYRRLKFLDSVDFVHDHILPKIQNPNKLDKVVLHPNCSMHKMNKIAKFKKIAETIAKDVQIPMYATCCGMAGDRGFLVPELTAAAVNLQVSEVKAINAQYHCSTSVTCNINLSIQTGKQYESLYSLIHKVL
jgi:D-lactate dehydrogenase